MKKYILKALILALWMVTTLTLNASEPIYIKLIESNINTTTYDSSFFNTNPIGGAFPYVDDSKGIVLTSGSTGMASSFFLKEKMSRASDSNPGFSTFFQLNIYKGSSSQAADGVVFIVAANTNSIGESGGGLGYEGVRDSVGIEFDFWNNVGSSSSYTPHLDISTNGNLASDGVMPGTFDSTFNSNYSSAQVGSLVRNYYVWIDWNESVSTLEIRVNSVDNTRPINPTYSETGLNLNVLNDTYYAGFTGATGGSNMTASIKQWYFANEYLETGVDVKNLSFVTDSTPPTSPTISYNDSLNQVIIDGASDALSGIYQVQYSFDNISYSVYQNPISINTETTLYARAIDNAGNISSIESFNFYALSYLENGSYTTLYYPEGITVSLPTDVSSPDGYSFVGFEDNPESETIITSMAISSTTEIYPKFTPNDYTITFNQTLGTLQSPLTQAYTSSITLPVLEEPGYTFLGWLNSEDILVDYQTMPLGNETLTALFEANDYTFDFSTTLGTTPSSITVPYLTTVELPILFEEGYTFNGWEIDRVLVTGSLVMPISGASLTAKFTPNDYTITFNQTLGTLQSPLTQAYTSSITLPVLEEPGYTFLGWLNSEDILVDYQTMPLGNETLTALFEANDYTIRFESITQLETELITASYLSLISLPSLALEGHSFSGWEGKDTLITNGSLTVPLNGITLTAIFEINQYTLSFATYNDEYFKPVDLDFMDPLTLPLPIKEGHTFKGWFEGSTFFRSTSMPSRDLLLKAQWEINSYQVTLKDGDEVIDQYEVNYGASLNLPTPQKNGYQFDQWMIDNEPFNLDRMPANDLVINAIYSLDLITVSYVIDGIKTEISVAYGETYSPSVPNKKGYIFNTWTVNDEPVESMTIEESGIEFIAEFYPAESIQRITTPLGTLELVLKTDELVQGLNTLNLPGGYRFVGFFTRPFGSGDSLNEELIIEDASNTIFYPYYLGNNTASTDLSTLLSLEGRAIPTKVQEPKITTPWLEIFGFTLTVIVMTSLYVTTKDKKHA